jgi:hypothetical protein
MLQEDRKCIERKNVIETIIDAQNQSTCNVKKIQRNDNSLIVLKGILSGKFIDRKAVTIKDFIDSNQTLSIELQREVEDQKLISQLIQLASLNKINGEPMAERVNIIITVDDSIKTLKDFR